MRGCIIWWSVHRGNLRALLWPQPCQKKKRRHSRRCQISSLRGTRAQVCWLFLARATVALSGLRWLIYHHITRIDKQLDWTGTHRKANCTWIYFLLQQFIRFYPLWSCHSSLLLSVIKIQITFEGIQSVAIADNFRKPLHILIALGPQLHTLDTRRRHSQFYWSKQFCEAPEPQWLWRKK